MFSTTSPKSESSMPFTDVTIFKIPTIYASKMLAFMETEQLPFQIITSEHSSESQHAITRLSPKKLKVLVMLAEGKGYQDIAQELGTSINTVRFRVKQIYKALNVKNKVEATRLYLTYNSTNI